MLHKYHIKYKKSKRLKSDFVLRVHRDFDVIQELDIEEAVVTTTIPLSRESRKSLKEIFKIVKVKSK